MVSTSRLPGRRGSERGEAADLNSSALAWVEPCRVSLAGQGRVWVVQVGRAVNIHLLEASECLGKFHIHPRGSGALRKPTEFFIIFCSFAVLG